MNKAFQQAANYFKAPPQELNHAQIVTRLYRRSLKLMMSWAIDRDLINEEATRIRSEFDKYKCLSPDSGLTKRLIREAKEQIENNSHPEQYVIPWMPGGSRFMRNPPLPLEVCFPDGIPEGEQVSPLPEINVDMTPLPAKKHILVDFAAKTYT